MARVSMSELLEIAPDVRKIAQRVAQFIGVPVSTLFIADHTHDGLSEGAYSITYEGTHGGACDWPSRFATAEFEDKVPVPAGWYLKAGSAWYLACYPDPDNTLWYVGWFSDPDGTL